jgi:hypothetical protein
MSFSNFFAVDGYSNAFCLYVTNKNIITVKPVYKGHSREPENVPFIYALFINGKIWLPFIESDLL